jgi:hypothetical protein
MNNLSKTTYALVRLLIIDRKYIFQGGRNAMMEILRDSKVTNYRILQKGDIRMYPTISLGTLMFTGGVGIMDGINVKASTTKLEDGKLIVNLSTKLRPEHYFLTGVFSLFLLGFSFSTESAWVLLYILGI